MAGRLMHIYNTIEGAESMKALQIALGRAYYEGLGYEVIEGGVVPKNALTGDNDYNTPRVYTYAEIEIMQDGRFGMPSLDNDGERFQDWRQMAADLGFADFGEEIEYEPPQPEEIEE